MPDEPQAPPPARQTGGALSRTIGGRPAWQWAALVGVAGAGIWLYAKRKSSTGTTAADIASQGIDPATGLPYSSETGNPGVLQPIIEQGLPGAAGKTGPAGPRGPAGPAGAPQKPTSGVGTRINNADFPRNISGVSALGKQMLTAKLGTIQNGKITGSTVGNSGAPVYALVQTGFGPVWEQYFNPAKLPNGTIVATLPQFKSRIQKQAA